MSGANPADMNVGTGSIFLATLLFASTMACDNSPEESASSAQTQRDDSTRPETGSQATTTRSPAGPADRQPAETPDRAGNRTPENDPFLLEGIPNLEDLIAMRDGDWLTILASAPRDGAPRPPTVTRATIPSLASFQQKTWNEGIVPFIAPSETFPKLEPGFTILFLGPSSKATAERNLALVEDGGVAGAYIKEGW